MKQNCKQNIINVISEIRMLPKNNPAKQCVLVLDEFTSHILSSILSMQQIIELGIKQLCRADKKKKPNPAAIAIYYLRSESVKFIFQDFSDQDIYFSINILISERADTIMKQIAKQMNIMDRLASFGQLLIPCNFIGQNQALLPKLPSNQLNKNLLSSIFGKKSEQMAVQFGYELYNTILASFCIEGTTSFKIYSYESKFSITAMDILKTKLQEHLNELRNLQKNKDKNVLGVNSTQIILLIMDRQIDIMSPLIRSFYYLPALIDLYDLQTQTSELKIISPKIEPTQISLDDPILAKYSNKIIYDAFVKINDDLEEYSKNNKAAQFAKQKKQKQNSANMTDKNSQQLRQIIRELPQYNQTVKNFKNNISIMDGIGKIKKQRMLDQLTELQHTIITGLNGRKQPEKDKKVLQKVWAEINKQKAIQQTDKFRIILEAITFLDISAEQKIKLIQLVGQNSKYGDIATKISLITRNNIRKYTFPYQQIPKSIKQFYVNRHHTPVANAVHDILSNKLPKKFKLQQIGHKNTDIMSKMKKMKQKPKIVVCMGGGLGYNEIVNIKQVYQTYIADSKQYTSQISFISDAYVNPKQYLMNLTNI